MEATGVYWKPVGRSSRTSSSAARQRPARQAGPRAQDRRQGRRVAVPARRGRAVGGELRAAQADPGAAQPDAVSQDADPGARSGRPTGCTRRWRTPGSSSTASPRTSSASRAGRCSTRCVRARPTLRCWPSWPRAGCAQKIPALREALEGRFDRLHALWIGAILAHIDFLDEQIDRAHRRDRGADRPFRAGR